MNLKYFILTLALMRLASRSTPLESNDQIMFIPDIAYKNANQQLVVNIYAWIYEQKILEGANDLLSKYLEINFNDLSELQKNRFSERSQLFARQSKQGKVIEIWLTDQIYVLPKTQKDGISETALTLSNQTTPDSILDFSFYNSLTHSSYTNQGIAYYSSPTGLSIISDIDDTIKDSNVQDTNTLIINTFLEPFKAVKHMSQWYNQLIDEYNAKFHYVSSSPIQVYPLLDDFIKKHHFPLGSIHLRKSTSLERILSLSKNSRQHKINTIKKILSAYPQRLFILVGDSGEKDPEIYAQIIQEYPEQVHCLVIRDVTGEHKSSSRYQQIFNTLKPGQWFIFKQKPPTLNDILPNKLNPL